MGQINPFKSGRERIRGLFLVCVWLNYVSIFLPKNGQSFWSCELGRNFGCLCFPIDAPGVTLSWPGSRARGFTLSWMEISMTFNRWPFLYSPAVWTKFISCLIMGFDLHINFIKTLLWTNCSQRTEKDREESPELELISLKSLKSPIEWNLIWPATPALSNLKLQFVQNLSKTLAWLQNLRTFFL